MIFTTNKTATPEAIISSARDALNAATEHGGVAFLLVYPFLFALSAWGPGTFVMPDENGSPDHFVLGGQFPGTDSQAELIFALVGDRLAEDRRTPPTATQLLVLEHPGATPVVRMRTPGDASEAAPAWARGPA
jgi:hypothetical protein